MLVESKLRNLYTVCHMNDDLKTKAEELINSGIGERYRLEHILRTLKNDRKLYNSDLNYLITMHEKLVEKMISLQKESEVLKRGLTKSPKLTPVSNRHALLKDEDLNRILEEQEKKKHQRLMTSKDSLKPLRSESKLGKFKKHFTKN
ncbi:MAG: hypothetical protein ACE5RJ_00745 [Nitrosopumilaceae archaeon]